MSIFKFDRIFYTKTRVNMHVDVSKSRLLALTRESRVSFLLRSYFYMESRVNRLHFVFTQSGASFSLREPGVLLTYLTVSTLPFFVLSRDPM